MKSRLPLSPQPAHGHHLCGAAAAPSHAQPRLLALQRAAGNRTVQRVLRRPAGQRVLQRRRVPSAEDLLPLIGDSSIPDEAAHRAGAKRLVDRAWEDLTPDERARAKTEALSGMTWERFSALPPGHQTGAWADAIAKVRPSLRLGDPLLINTGPRAGTHDAANLRRLVDNANRVLAAIASGRRDADLRQVFGAANVGRAKRRYANGRRWMNRLHKRGQIVTDRSGYSLEVGLGGSSMFQSQLTVVDGAVDKPDDDESIVIMIHEAVHAGNADVLDHGYINIEPDTFRGLPARVKLRNAAHYEVVPRRVLDAEHFQFAGQTFRPAGSSAAIPPMTPRLRAMRGASEDLRQAWAVGVDLHKLYVHLLSSPWEWNLVDLSTFFAGIGPGLTFKDTLPFWSKVMRLTIHARTHIDPRVGRVSTNPVTLIDIALSEGVVRKLARALHAMPDSEADATTLLSDKATAAERAQATTVDAERDLLIRLVLRERAARITGDEERDFRVVKQMATAGDRSWRSILARRSPADFPG
jgi:hypothetical protein